MLGLKSFISLLLNNLKLIKTIIALSLAYFELALTYQPSRIVVAFKTSKTKSYFLLCRATKRPTAISVRILPAAGMWKKQVSPWLWKCL